MNLLPASWIRGIQQARYRSRMDALVTQWEHLQKDVEKLKPHSRERGELNRQLHATVTELLRLERQCK